MLRVVELWRQHQLLAYSALGTRRKTQQENHPGTGLPVVKLGSVGIGLTCLASPFDI